MDLTSLEAPDPIGFTRLKFHYFDERARLTDTRAFPHALLSPVIREVSGDGLSDVVFTDLRLGVLLGRADRSWVPETFSSYRVPDTSIRTLSVFDGPIQLTPAFIVFATFDGVSGLYVTDAANAGSPRLLASLGGPIEGLVGDPVSGRVIADVDASPCEQVVLALRGEVGFSVFDACVRDALTREPLWLGQALEWRIELDPPQPIDGAPQLVDVNRDELLDVLVSGGGRTYVSYGDGAALARAVPYVLPLSSAPGDVETNVPMPLAAGDVTADGAVDFVFGTGLLLSVPGTGPLLPDYISVGAPAPGYFGLATIADLNDNGRLDVVTASKDRSGISFFNGTGGRDLTLFGVATSRPVQHLAVGDFDGDLIRDLAFTETGASDGAVDSVMIAFGAAYGPPLPPVPVARLRDIEQLNAYREGGLDHLILTSSEMFEEQRRGLVTLLLGSGDRIPTALYDLTTFAADGSTDGSSAIRVLAGRFTASDRADVLALAVKGELSNDPELWRLAALLTPASTPIRLAGRLDPLLHPVTGTGADATLTLATATLDVDADGRDEALLVMPAEDAERCGMLILGVEADALVQRDLIVLAEPCLRVELLPVDVDRDGFVDLALLIGRADGAGRQLSIFWNDGAGFDGERRTLVTAPAVSAQAFAVLPSTSVSGVSVAYATEQGVELASLGENARELEGVRFLAPLSGITGMSAADLDGDGAVDLALAANGNLNVLKAILEAL
jgi:hypothetical protein